MENSDKTPRHLRTSQPSPWIERFAPLVKPQGRVLDLACGGGRHARLFLDLGHKVLCVDKNTDPVADLRANPNAEILTADLETEDPVFSENGPLANRTFDAIVVSNYLYRDHLIPLVDALNENGVLIYETFAKGNEQFGKPRNPDHLLLPGELLDLAQNRLTVVAYEHGLIESHPLPGIKQRLCAVKSDEPQPLFPAAPG